MKNIIIIIVLVIGVNMHINGQQMRWVLSEEVEGACAFESDCAQDIICYSLEFTPRTSGILTSYTTGFFVDCDGENIQGMTNQSCTINDKSNVIDACAEHGKMLVNCSGNTGQLLVKRSKSVILHQVCFDLKQDGEIFMEADELTGNTVSIDVAEDKFTTDIAEFDISGRRSIVSPCNEEYDVLVLGDIEVATEGANLTWNPVHHKATGKYYVERSLDGKNYEVLTTLEANADLTSNMRYVDASLERGAYEYRVKYVEGYTTSRSNVVSGEFDGEVSLLLYPNPSTGMMKISFDDGGQDVQIDVMSTDNKLVSSQKLSCGALHNLDFTALTPGSYIVNLKGEYKTEAKRIVIIK